MQETSNTERKFSKKVVGFVAAAGFLLTIGLIPSLAAPPEACEYTYYSDATKTTVVGMIGAYCTHTERWGIVTAWYDKECFTSCGGGPN